MAGKGVFSVTVKNVSDEVVSASVSTAWGEKSLTVQPGKSVLSGFTVRSTSVDAGEIVVEGTVGESAFDSTTPYDAATCG